MNFTLEITASPELLGVLTMIASGVTKGAEAKSQQNVTALEFFGFDTPQSVAPPIPQQAPTAPIAPSIPQQAPTMPPAYPQAAVPAVQQNNTYVPPAPNSAPVAPPAAPIATPPTYTIADLQNGLRPSYGRRQTA